MGTNGRVVGEAGSVLIIQGGGLTAIPASYGLYWYSNFKNGGRIKSSAIQHGGTKAASELRPLQADEKVYLINLEINQTEIVFYVQSCGTCDVSAADPNNATYRARLAIGFQKGYLDALNIEEIRETIGQVFKIDTPRAPTTDSKPKVEKTAAVLKLPSIYVSAQTPVDQIQLNADNSFSLQEAGQSYRGTFVVNGNSLEINISDANTKTTMTIQGSNLTGPGGETWTLREQAAPAAASGGTLRNEDIIKDG